MNANHKQNSVKSAGATERGGTGRLSLFTGHPARTAIMFAVLIACAALITFRGTFWEAVVFASLTTPAFSWNGGRR